MSISVFRKPTYKDTLIPYTSNHPIQQKYAAVRFLYNRLNSYHLQDKEHQQERNIIQSILYNNSFPVQIQNPLDNHSSHPKNLLQVQKPLDNHSSQPQNPLNKKKWCTFTHIGKETTFITKIFRHSDIKIAYRTNNTLQKHLAYGTQQQDKFTQSGVYKLTCPDCGKAYVGQTGRDFYTRFNEHKRSFRYNSQHSKYAQHLIEHGHASGNI